jgi:hypothetical protein
MAAALRAALRTFYFDCCANVSSVSQVVSLGSSRLCDSALSSGLAVCAQYAICNCSTG